MLSECYCEKIVIEFIDGYKAKWEPNKNVVKYKVIFGKDIMEIRAVPDNSNCTFIGRDVIRQIKTYGWQSCND